MFQCSYNDKATMIPEVYKLPVYYDLQTTNHPSHLYTKSVKDPDQDHEHQYFADVPSDYGTSRDLAHYGPPYQEIRHSKRTPIPKRSDSFIYHVRGYPVLVYDYDNFNPYSYAYTAILQTRPTTMDFQLISQDLHDAVNPVPHYLPPGSPKSDPTFFMTEPRCLADVKKLPFRYQQPWINAFIKEFRGIITTNTIATGEFREGDTMTPVMDIYKCKLDKDGLIDKLKCRIVFRGDLFEMTLPEESWNPFASYLALRFFLAICARFNMSISSLDWIQAYLQVKMAEAERVFIKLPNYWRSYLPSDLANYCGRPLLLKNALYGYPFSGKRLYEEQERFMKEQKFKQSSLLGSWYKRLPNNGLFLILLFADDQLMACTDASVLHDYMLAMKRLYKIEWHATADWFLNARINRFANGDISLDQSRYSKAIVQRYLPNAEHDPLHITEHDMAKYMSPVPNSFVFTKYDCSYELNDVRLLEEQFGFRYIEYVGSLIFLANTAVRQLFAIRKLCRYMHLPGHNHFAVALHLLHHLRCYPARPLIYYHDVHTSPVAAIVRNIADNASMEIDPTLIYFTDSAFGDCDEGKSTGCYFGFLQGGIVDMASSVPNLTANSAAEAECSYASVASLATLQVKRTFMEIVADNVDASYTVPMFTDSKSTIDIARNDRGTARTRHMGRRKLLVRTMSQSGNILLIWCDGETQQLADIGTKAKITYAIVNYKLSICEAPIPHQALNVSLLPNDGYIN
jgi:hypothetical protein